MICLLLTCSFLQGCQGNAPIGTGPIEFGPRLRASYDQYRQTARPGACVINERSAFWTYCDQPDCRGAYVSRALSNCRAAGGGECFIYDIGGRVVWRRDEPPPVPSS
jgi:hypothetical protein